MAVLVDTSVLLRLRDPADPACRAALDPEQVVRHGVCLCAQVLIEYWVVATRPAVNNGFGLSPDEAAEDVRSLRALLPCLPEPACARRVPAVQSIVRRSVVGEYEAPRASR
jgi:hypothetical protein